MHEDCYFKSAFSLWKFSSQTQTIIHYLKYMEFKRLADNIGYFMSLKLKRLNFPENDTIIIPIPLHKTRERERGYNQSSLICQSFVKGTDFQCLDKCVIRTRYTKTQTKLSAMDRHKNVSGAFKVVDPVKLKNKVVLLIDDVLTTGATMNGCAKELNRFGVKEIHLFSAVKA
ncbi:hypothetical protein B6I21_03555 [candidate division KSB1 bacterium 4572_119]|nr:MAG: hypothetical protein B6I21_03555 [candidate division KSB1 bacterium 4572_119]